MGRGSSQGQKPISAKEMFEHGQKLFPTDGHRWSGKPVPGVTRELSGPRPQSTLRIGPATEHSPATDKLRQGLNEADLELSQTEVEELIEDGEQN